jgi:hypothetical protein
MVDSRWVVPIANVARRQSDGVALERGSFGQ